MSVALPDVMVNDVPAVRAVTARACGSATVPRDCAVKNTREFAVIDVFDTVTVPATSVAVPCFPLAASATRRPPIASNVPATVVADVEGVPQPVAEITAVDPAPIAMVLLVDAAAVVIELLVPIKTLLDPVVNTVDATLGPTMTLEAPVVSVPPATDPIATLLFAAPVTF